MQLVYIQDMNEDNVLHGHSTEGRAEGGYTVGLAQGKGGWIIEVGVAECVELHKQSYCPIQFHGKQQ